MLNDLTRDITWDILSSTLFQLYLLYHLDLHNLVKDPACKTWWHLVVRNQTAPNVHQTLFKSEQKDMFFKTPSKQSEAFEPSRTHCIADSHLLLLFYGVVVLLRSLEDSQWMSTCCCSAAFLIWTNCPDQQKKWATEIMLGNRFSCFREPSLLKKCNYFGHVLTRGEGDVFIPHKHFCICIPIFSSPSIFILVRTKKTPAQRHVQYPVGQGK